MSIETSSCNFRGSRAEARIAAALPAAPPVPRLQTTVDDGDWVALIFDEIDGRLPHEPWHRDELTRVIDAVTELSRTLTPCPIADVPDAEDQIRGEMLGYRDLATDPPDDLGHWEARHLDRLAELAESALEHVDGDTLVHFDLRADNILLDGDDVWIVDWPWAFRGIADPAGFPARPARHHPGLAAPPRRLGLTGAAYAHP